MTPDLILDRKKEKTSQIDADVCILVLVSWLKNCKGMLFSV